MNRDINIIEVGDEVCTESYELFFVTKIDIRRGEVFGLDQTGGTRDYCIDGVWKTGKYSSQLSDAVRSLANL